MASVRKLEVDIGLVEGTMIRSTRADEEDGRLELVNSLPVGRLAYLFATFIVMVFVRRTDGLLH